MPSVYNKHIPNSSVKVYLNSRIVDISSIEIEKILPKLNKLTTLAVNYIISNYKKFSFFIGSDLELSAIFTNDNYIKKLNYKWRGNSQATNVLSMRLFEKEDIRLSKVVLLGDIVISLDTALKESNSLAVSLSDHLFRLMVHGIVHIFGFNHSNDKDALIMENLEKIILSQFNNLLKPLTSNYWSE